MRAVLVAAAVSLLVGLFGTPLYIRLLARHGYGQSIRDDGPTSHHTKRGTPTMGGMVIIVGALVGYVAAHLITAQPADAVSGVLVLFLMTGLGLVGFLDDYIKICKQRSLGLRPAKLIGQAVVGAAVRRAGAAVPEPTSSARRPRPRSRSSATPGSTWPSPALRSAWCCSCIWAYVMVAATRNGVNLTDGLDGLATGACTMVFGAYVLIGIWQSNQSCRLTGIETSSVAPCYEVRDPLRPRGGRGRAWWAPASASCGGTRRPAKIFMGDTGSLALGGALAGLAITTRTELLLLLLGGLFVLITLSVIIQVGSFKLTGRRVFLMAPLQHHFELRGWGEVTIVIRFWIIAGLFVASAWASSTPSGWSVRERRRWRLDGLTTATRTGPGCRSSSPGLAVSGFAAADALLQRGARWSC